MLDVLQTRLGHRFSDINLLERALTHRSYLNENPDYPLGNNERLEFLGDSVLEFVASDLLYRRFPQMGEGYMTRLRAGLVRTETLADFARELRLGPMIHMARGEADSGGQERQTILCDTFEAIIGALYLDGGFTAVFRVVLPLFETTLQDILINDSDKDPKSLFQEWSQATFGITPIYHTLATLGEEHEKVFVVEVHMGEEIAGWGNARNKQIAEQAAARQALLRARHGEFSA